MESCLAQVLQKDVGKRLQVGQELIDYFSDRQKSADLEHDQTILDKLVDGLATSWVNSSNYKVSLTLGDALEGGKIVLADQDWPAKQSSGKYPPASLASDTALVQGTGRHEERHVGP